MQQRRFQQVRRFGDAVTSGHQLGTADRKKLLGAKADSVEPAPIAVAVPDRNIDLFPNEVDMMHRCGNPQIDAERVLQRFDLMADSALGDTELLSRSREAFASRRSLERLEGVQWWQLAGHGPLS